MKDQFDPRPLHYVIEMDGDVLYDGIAGGLPMTGDEISIDGNAYIVTGRRWERYIGVDGETTDLSVVTLIVRERPDTL